MGFDYTVKAHPTTYAGVNFRSRLEARWAAFFDECGWEWEYEPIDLKGWSPDFSIKGHKGDILVEVKPVDFWTGDAVSEAIWSADSASRFARNQGILGCGGAIDSNFENEILVVGTSPFPVEVVTDCYSIGIFLTCDVLGSAVLCTPDGKKWDFVSDEGTWDKRISGDYSGRGTYSQWVSPRHVKKAWRSAGNKVQYTPSKEN